MTSLRARMRIARPLIDEIVAHAHAEAPNECCGLVSGTDGTASEIFRARNEMASPLAYNVHPQDLLRITSAIEDRGEELAAIYHSHTKSPAEPSQTDVNLAANWPDPVYLICSIADADPVVRGWHIRDGAVTEVELAVE
jgi:[CysO sulfur-carrier protein]-S-L-cysteine hydrolase